jgi:hypothetical protein
MASGTMSRGPYATYLPRAITALSVLALILGKAISNFLSQEKETKLKMPKIKKTMMNSVHLKNFFIGLNVGWFSNINQKNKKRKICLTYSFKNHQNTEIA